MFQFLLPVCCLHSQISYVPTRSPAESRRCLVPPQNCRVKQEVGPGLLKGPHFPTSLLEKCQWTNKSLCSSPLWSPLNHVSNHPRPLVCLWTIWTQLFLLPRTQSLYQVLHFRIVSSVQCRSFPTARRARSFYLSEEPYIISAEIDSSLVILCLFMSQFDSKWI